MNVTIPKPNPKQAEFFRARKRFVGYGGARGGGKSWCIRQKAKMMALRWPGIKILILRHTFPELRENHIIPMKMDLRGLADYKEMDKSFIFPNGSRIVFGYCQHEHDVDQYQGTEADVICIDEATGFTEYQFRILSACLRGANDFPKRMYLTANPGGIGHTWYKRLFIDREYHADENPEDYEFIQAKLTDNPVLMEKDPDYAKMLDALPPGIREAWRDGDWTVFLGQYFPEFRPETHCFAPRVLPDSWPRYRSIDYGLDMLACYWHAVDYDGRIWTYRELCQPGLIVSEAAAAMKEATPQGERVLYTIAPPDMWSRQKDTGRTMAEVFMDNGIPLVKASNDRIQGWMQVKEALKQREDGQPGLMISRDCKELIKCLQAVQHDEKKPNDVAVEPHEYTHSPDSLRYMCIHRALGAELEPEPVERDEGVTDYEDFMLGSGGASDSYLMWGG